MAAPKRPLSPTRDTFCSQPSTPNPSTANGRTPMSWCAPPSSGLRVCSHVAQLRRLARDDLFGFAMTDQIGREPSSAHYFEQARPAMHHNWRKERQLLDTKISQPAASGSDA